MNLSISLSKVSGDGARSTAWFIKYLWPDWKGAKGSKRIGIYTISLFTTIDAIISGEPQLLQSIHRGLFSVRFSALKITKRRFSRDRTSVRRSKNSGGSWERHNLPHLPIRRSRSVPNFWERSRSVHKFWERSQSVPTFWGRSQFAINFGGRSGRGR